MHSIACRSDQHMQGDITSLLEDANKVSYHSPESFKEPASSCLGCIALEYCAASRDRGYSKPNDSPEYAAAVQVGVKEAKLRAKQAQEMDLLQGRGARGRDQLKRAHAQVCLPLSVLLWDNSSWFF